MFSFLFRCNGGYPSSAWKFWTDDGLVSGGLYDSHVGEFCMWETDAVVVCAVRVSEPIFASTGCRPYTIPPCEHHVNGSRPSCTGEGGDTPECVFQCEPGYTPSYKKDKHFGKKCRRKRFEPLCISDELGQVCLHINNYNIKCDIWTVSCLSRRYATL